MTVCGVVLAAGGSARFGSPKQLAPLGGVPLLQHAVDVAAGAGVLDRVVVVLGANAAVVAEALTPGRAEVVVCEDWARGLSASLQAGIAACAGADWIVITLGDEPDLPPAAIERIVECTRHVDADVEAVRARWDGRPGHPVALRAALAAQADKLAGDVGARPLLEDARVLDVELGELGSSRDVDSPEDLSDRH